VRVIIDSYNRQSLNNHKNRSFARERSNYRQGWMVALKTRQHGKRRPEIDASGDALRAYNFTTAI
jgi:hypothetical protein